MSYASEVLADSPSLYWRLGASGITDQSGNGRNGTAVGSPTIGGVAGALALDSDAATAFSGTQYIQTTTYLPFVNGTTRTFEGWAWRDSTADFQSPFRGQGGVAPSTFYLMSGQDVRFFPEDATPVIWAAAWPGNTVWAHFALIVREAADTAELYINGVSQGSKPMTLAFGGGQTSFRVGDLLPGRVDEFAIYEYELSAARIKAHANNKMMRLDVAPTGKPGATPVPAILGR